MLAQTPPTLEVYYASSCAACRLDLPAVAQFVKENGATVRIVILTDRAQAHEEIAAVSPQLSKAAIAKGEATPREVLHMAGDDDELLPYARAVSADNKTCAAWRGRMTLAKARELVASCARRLTSPSPRRP